MNSDLRQPDTTEIFRTIETKTANTTKNMNLMHQAYY